MMGVGSKSKDARIWTESKTFYPHWLPPDLCISFWYQFRSGVPCRVVNRNSSMRLSELVDLTTTSRACRDNLHP